MSVSPSFRAFVLELDDDTLYFKVDDATRPQFTNRGMAPFSPYGEGGEVMQYYEVPADVMEDADALSAWVEAAIAVARRAPSSRASQSYGGWL